VGLRGCGRGDGGYLGMVVIVQLSAILSMKKILDELQNSWFYGVIVDHTFFPRLCRSNSGSTETLFRKCYDASRCSSSLHHQHRRLRHRIRNSHVSSTCIGLPRDQSYRLSCICISSCRERTLRTRVRSAAPRLFSHCGLLFLVLRLCIT
jgi:hypothetical protein